MHTLLEKVKTIEDETQALITEAEQKGRQAIADLVQSEPAVLAEVQQRATKQGQTIIQEAVAKAQTETARVRQDAALTTESIQKLVQKNKDAALKAARQLFTEDYLLREES